MPTLNSTRGNNFLRDCVAVKGSFLALGVVVIVCIASYNVPNFLVTIFGKGVYKKIILITMHTIHIRCCDRLWSQIA